MYDPVIALFISADSVVPDFYDPQSLNRYAYCRNNPLKYVDPDGHDFRQASYFDPVSRQIVNKPPQKIRSIVDIRIGKSFRLRFNTLTFALSIATGRIPGIGLPTGVAGPKTASAAKANATASKGSPIPGTGKKAGDVYSARKLKKGQSGPPKEGNKIKRSDANQEASKYGKRGGVITSKSKAKRGGGRQDPGHQGGPSHGHLKQKKGHLWHKIK